jgi:hypothetical protein
LIKQGSTGASLTRIAHLDHGLYKMFTGREHAISYGSVLQAPYGFQYDVLAAGVLALRANNLKMDMLMKQKNLNFKTYNCSYILYDSKRQ